MIQITIWQWLLVLKRQIYIILAFSTILDQENFRGGLGTINTHGMVQYWIHIMPFWIPLLTHVIQTSVQEMSLFQFGFSRSSGDVLSNGENKVRLEIMLVCWSTSIRLLHEDSYWRAYMYHCRVWSSTWTDFLVVMWI